MTDSVIKPNNEEHGNLLWYSLRSEFARKQIYYLAQTASQPELKMDYWKSHFIIPIPKGDSRKTAIENSSKFFNHVEALLDARNFSLR